MALPSEVKTLLKALDSLQTATTPTTLASCSRTVARAADDLELVCEETVDPSLSAQLNSYVDRARQAVKTARRNARAAALKADRTALIEPPTVDQKEFEGSAERLAAEINDALRATAAVVSEEIQRSKVAGDVVEESTRRLRRTTDQHGVYADGIVSGASTLKSIRRTDLVANLVLVLCFALFFVAAAYVTNRRIQNSNIATFIVRPTYKIVSLPLRITSWVFKSSFSKRESQPLQSRYPSPSDPQHVTQKDLMGQREPREAVETELSDAGGDRSLRDTDTHDKNAFEEAQETPYVSPSQHLRDRTETDVAQQSRKPPSSSEQNIGDHKMSEQWQHPSPSEFENDTHMDPVGRREPQKDMDTELSNEGGDRSLRDTYARDNILEEAQEAPYVSPSPHLVQRAEEDVTQHSRKHPSVSDQNGGDDGMSENPNQAFVYGDNSKVEKDLIEDRTKEDPKSTTFVDNGDTLSSAPTGLPKSSSDEQPGVKLKSSLPSRYQTHDGELNTAPSQNVVQDRPSTESKISRLSEASNGSIGIDQDLVVVTNEAQDGDKAQSDSQGLPDEEDLEALLYPLLSSHQSVPGGDLKRDASPTLAERRESRSKREREDEIDIEQRHTLSSDSVSDDKSSQTETEGRSDVEESEPLLVIPLPYQEEYADMNNADHGNGASEVVEQNQPRSSKDTIDELLQSENGKKGASETENKTKAQDTTGTRKDLSQPDKVTSGKANSETEEQNQAQISKSFNEPPGPASDGKSFSETEEESEPQTVKEKANESLQTKYDTGRRGISEAIKREEFEAMKDESNETHQSDDPSDRKGTSEAVDQTELQAAKDKEDVTAAEESTASLGDAESPGESEHLESRESSGEKENEAPRDFSFSSLSEASDSEEGDMCLAISGDGEQISSEEQNEDELHDQLSFPVFEGRDGVQPEGMSMRRVQYDLSRICLVSGLDSDLLQVSAVSAWIHL
ncbi:lipase [Gracilaria domingensis]|nr:lipase [Gracilaria domingensis]